MSTNQSQTTLEKKQLRQVLYLKSILQRNNIQNYNTVDQSSGDISLYHQVKFKLPEKKNVDLSVRIKKPISIQQQLPSISHRLNPLDISSHKDFDSKIHSNKKLSMNLKHRSEFKRHQLVEFLRGEQPHVPFSQIFHKKKLYQLQKEKSFDNGLPQFNIINYQGLQL
ncbi:hypothetical protein pb186bvf_000089 [Paramecium bursaria]